MSDKTNGFNEVIQGVGKVMMMIGLVSISVIAKLAFDMRNGELSKKQIKIKVVLSLFAGCMATIVCETFGWQKWTKLVTPVSTLLGESLVIYVMANWVSIMNKFFPNWTNGNGNEKKKEDQRKEKVDQSDT